ncbi:uncharacterized protein ALTATR162_LOCUS49 [Alternaria atra]|uniref:Uncharacterized protein n=1 Tax=Alternaria atra TaxID=119953 RepID=A0A8J2HUR6_9PLEO|nr:uncharacterized protein ALTATR162_LOCUS49 [Alternaria atra]CAG5137188.1 unnamed protein product [Alternaria atra]
METYGSQGSTDEIRCTREKREDCGYPGSPFNNLSEAPERPSTSPPYPACQTLIARNIMRLVGHWKGVCQQEAPETTVPWQNASNQHIYSLNRCLVLLCIIQLH